MTRVAFVTLWLSCAPAVAMGQAPVPVSPPAVPSIPAAPPPAPAPIPDAPAPPTPPGRADVFRFDGADIVIPRFDIDLSDLRGDFLNLDDALEAFRVAQAIAPIAVPAPADIASVQSHVEQARIAAEANLAAHRRLGLARDPYNTGLTALQQRQYERALEAFDLVLAEKNARTDAALYWKAFAEFRLARTNAALQTISRLQKEHADSRYLGDARVLEAEARAQLGSPVDPSSLDDNDEIKLLAIQGLRQTTQAVPLLKGVLSGANSLNVKKRALYVLALNDSPQAQTLLVDYAKGAGTPDLQQEALRYLASRQDMATISPLLRDVYLGSRDQAVKRGVIDTYLAMGRDQVRWDLDQVRLRYAGRGGGSMHPFPARATATTSGSGTVVNTITTRPTVTPEGVRAVTSDLLALYKQETDVELRRDLATALASLGAIDQLVPLLGTEKSADVQRHVIRALVSHKTPELSRALVQLYDQVSSVETREVIVASLAGQRDADALVTLARKERDTRLKTAIVRHLSSLAPQSDAAANYLMEVIK